MTRLLVISEKYWPYGGAELATHLILNILKSSKKSLGIDVVTGYKKPERLHGVNYIYSPLLDVPTKIHLWKNLVILNKVSWFRRLLEKADIIYIPRIAYPLIPLAKKYGKKVIVHLHNYQPVNFESVIFSSYSENFKSGIFHSVKQTLLLEMLEYNDLKRALASSMLSYINYLCKFWLSQADIIICVSHRQCEIIAKALPELANKLSIIHNPLPDIPLIKRNLKDPAFLYLGGDSYIKGFHIFLEASQRLLKRYPEASFMLAGNYRSSSTRIVSRLGRNYSLLGYVRHDEILKLYSHSIALLFTSICEEPLPYAVIESMLTGTIPIASRVGGVPEIVGGTYAENFTFTPGSVSELIDRMEAVLSMSREQLNDIGYRLRDSVLRRFNNERIKRELLKIFNQC